jgi:hypothetical protein
VAMAVVGDNIDMYLSQLGFMPPFGGGGHLNGQQVPGVAETFAGEGSAEMPAAARFGTGNANELGSWFSGNTHILGLLEEDLSEFEPRMWS